jgi:hypothetical protein
VSRLQGDELVNFDVTGPDGKEVPWRGSARINSKEAAPSSFVVLDKYQEISVKRTISLKDGAGFIFDKPGQYSVTGEYSLGPSERLAPFAAGTKIPTGTFRSAKAAFCIEACVMGSVAGQNGAMLSELSQPHTNAPQAALDTVRVFYTDITRYRPLGIPGGRARKALWPLMSKRLVHELDGLQVCDDDYYRRYGAILQANTYKPATPWLEVGLFSGPNEAGDPMRFSILSSRAIGNNRVDVHLRFTHKQTYCCGHPTSYDHAEGVVTAVLENKRWVIDDFVAMYENDELIRLSDGYSVCKAGQWVGEKPY